MLYIYQHASWPNFTWDHAHLAPGLAEVAFLQGRILGRLDSLRFSLKKQVALTTLTSEIVTSSAIEGEHLNLAEVRSSVARTLGIETAGMVPSGHRVDSVVELMVDATDNYLESFSDQRLFGWHAALFPSGRSGLNSISVGEYRRGDMQVVSGPAGRERIHYEAPAPEKVPGEMARFLEWVNSEPTCPPLIKAAIAHFWFVIIHPFEDGNGRLARAITESLLARSDRTSERYYSVSSQILAEREDYYAALKRTQHSDGDITAWLEWFIGCLCRALTKSAMALDVVAKKTEFWDRHAQTDINQRQEKVLNKLLGDFEGKLTTAKWAKMTKTSHDTALRDIQDLIEKGILEKGPSGGRSTSYQLVAN